MVQLVASAVRKPASSVAVSLMVTSLLYLKLAPPVNSLAVSAHHCCCSVAVAPGRLGLEVDQLDEATVLGYPRSCTKPADRCGASFWIHQSSAAQIFPASATCP
jgi:hypothetical protein